MKCLIVSKTRKGSRACVGAIEAKTRKSLRLLESDGSDPFEHTYSIGQVWDLNYIPHSPTVAPHTESVRVTNRIRLYDVSLDRVASVLRNLPHRGVWCGSSSNLFDGMLRYTLAGKGYIGKDGQIPDYSTGQWEPDQDLLLTKDNRGKTCYSYESHAISLIPYVGFEEPIEVIPAGTLVRVSLAQWWLPSDWEDGSERCYLQLSGWYL